jgi:hypothetical protein
LLSVLWGVTHKIEIFLAISALDTPLKALRAPLIAITFYLSGMTRDACSLASSGGIRFEGILMTREMAEETVTT